jgi:enoyl-CoA hydratase
MVQGYCIMGGLILASACDIILAAENAQFTDRAVRQGAPHVQYLSLPWDIGVRKTKELVFTGDFIDAQEALRLGLVNRVVPLDRLETETMDLARRIAMQDPFVVRLAKKSLNQAQDTMGFTASVEASFRNHQIADTRRNVEGMKVTPRKPDESVKEWVARRDKDFGDHKGQ